jgi:CheY-like chemotaxis protein
MHAVTNCSTDSESIAVPKNAEWGHAPILVVDDSNVSRNLAGRLIQHGTGRSVIYAENGSEALSLVKRIGPCLVLTDLHMPKMDGFELVEAIRANFPRIPVILMTAYGSEAVAALALKAGAASYVPKKDLAKDLVGTLRQILKVIEVKRRRQQVLACQTVRSSSFEIANDPDLLAPLIGIVQEDLDAFAIGDETARIRVAVALQESLANALFHGNLECSSDLRQEDERNFYSLANQRRESEPYQSRRIHVESRVDRHEARIVIRDEGPGFDVSSLDKPFDPEDLMRVGGRGMILIRTFVDEVIHNKTGNLITLVKRK